MLSAKAVEVSTVRRQAEVLELKSAIVRNLSELRQSQRILMPGLAPILDDLSDDDTTGEGFKLFLPSELSTEERATWCPPDIPALELRFRYAQADDSLAELRRVCRLLQGIRDQNTKHLSQTQRSITRSQGLFNGFKTRIRRCAARYSHARDAMLALDPDQQLSPGWAQRFQELNTADLRGPGREPDEPSEGQFVPSWIWLIPRSKRPPPATTSPTNHPTRNHGNGTTPGPDGSAAADNEITDFMRAHWAKCQARADRYDEEVSLIVEEMGRTLRYFEWKQSWWLSLQSERAKSLHPPPVDVQRGLHAYAHRQANIYQVLVISFANRWRKTLVSHGLCPSWLSRYPATVDPLSSRPSRGHRKLDDGLAEGEAAPEPARATHESISASLSPPSHDEGAGDPGIEVNDDDGSEGDGDEEGDDDYDVDPAEVFDLDD